jgi:hypothetical protein
MRESVLQFRNGSVSYLITTDLAARGLDIPEMNHVIHYHLPQKRMSSHIETVERHVCYLQDAYIIAHESEKNGIYQQDGRFKLESFTT